MLLGIWVFDGLMLSSSSSDHLMTEFRAFYLHFISYCNLSMTRIHTFTVLGIVHLMIMLLIYVASEIVNLTESNNNFSSPKSNIVMKLRKQILKLILRVCVLILYYYFKLNPYQESKIKVSCWHSKFYFEILKAHKKQICGVKSAVFAFYYFKKQVESKSRSSSFFFVLNAKILVTQNTVTI